MSVTIKKIAEHSGMSVPSVSQILNHKGLYRQETRDKVLASARKLGYRPNAAARSTRMGEFGAVALLISTDPQRSTLPNGMLRGILTGLGDRDLQLQVTMLPDEKLTSEGFVPRILTQSMSDGLLINYTDHIPEKMIELIREHHVPSIWLNARLERDCVMPDDIDAGRRAAEHLLAMGHRRIVYVDYSASGHYSSDDRYVGYAAAMAQAGLAARRLGGVDGLDRRIAQSRALLGEADRPTAIVSYGGGSSNPICHAAVDMGLRIPDDLSIVHFGGRPAVHFADKLFTTMTVPEEQMGHEAVAMLTRRITQPSNRLDSLSITYDFELGATCAPPS